MKYLNKKNVITFIVLVAAYIIGRVLIDIGIIDSYVQLNIVLIGINIILAVSLNLITGFTGQFTLGHAAFMAIGAYTSAVFTAKLGQPFIVAIIASGIVASFAGILIGIPTLRLKGDYLAIATLGFGEIVRIIATNMDYIGGAIGFNDIPQYTNWTWIYVMTVLTVLLIRNFINSYHGRACIAIRENEIAAEAMGVNTTFYKVLAFLCWNSRFSICKLFLFYKTGFIWIYEIYRYFGNCGIWRYGEHSGFYRRGDCLICDFSLPSKYSGFENGNIFSNIVCNHGI